MKHILLLGLVAGSVLTMKAVEFQTMSQRIEKANELSKKLDQVPSASFASQFLQELYIKQGGTGAVMKRMQGTVGALDEKWKDLFGRDSQNYQDMMTAIKQKEAKKVLSLLLDVAEGRIKPAISTDTAAQQLQEQADALVKKMDSNPSASFASIFLKELYMKQNISGGQDSIMGQMKATLRSPVMDGKWKDLFGRDSQNYNDMMTAINNKDGQKALSLLIDVAEGRIKPAISTDTRAQQLQTEATALVKKMDQNPNASFAITFLKELYIRQDTPVDQASTMRQMKSTLRVFDKKWQTLYGANSENYQAMITAINNGDAKEALRLLLTVVE